MAPVPMIAVAHGSRDPRAAATVAGLLDAVRDRRPDVPVHASFLDHAPPTPDRVLDGLAQAGAPSGARRLNGGGRGLEDGGPSGARRLTGGGRGLEDGAPSGAVVLPLLLTAAYHSKTDIPGVLNRVRARHPRMRLRTAETLGPHPLLMDALERRLSDAGVEPGDPDTAVVLVSAGSSHASANATIARLARGWRRRGWRDVVPAYASAARPGPAEAVAALLDAGAPRVAVASYFLAPGYFADKVRTAALAAGAAAVSPVLGAAPEVADLIVRRYDEALEPAVRTATAV
ncbi:sirohydrochlorin chelatase [Spirillospora sp. NPDC048819]|uniref:sirohydrochlorin chelatase n=1 Tax=Spirillospora sp. NPDC048819 TaxID=3155268 RepID=UPI0033E82DAB